MPSEFIEDRRRRFPWRVFWFLLGAALAGAAAAIPMALEVLVPIMQRTPPPSLLPLIIAVGAAQNLTLLAVVIGVGLLISRKLGLETPLLEGWLYRERSSTRLVDSLKAGVLVGVTVGVLVLVPLLVAAPHLPGLPLASAARVPIWKRFVVGFYGGIDEEILARLFLLSLIAWLGTRIFRKDRVKLSSGGFWFANVTAAILFGLGHLPSVTLVMKITPVVVVLALVLNGIPAISFGVLFRKRGLESAMIAHFCADFVLWVIGPAFLRH